MNRYIGIALAALLLGAPTLAHGAGEHAGMTSAPQEKGLIKILAPRANATVGKTVTVKWQLKKGGKAHHVHLWLDGEEIGPQQGRQKVLRDLMPGPHTVKLGVATSSHKEFASDTVKFTVK